MIDEKTVYLRMPATFMEPETLLMVLRNLLKAAYDREKRGGPAPARRRSRRRAQGQPAGSRAQADIRARRESRRTAAKGAGDESTRQALCRQGHAAARETDSLRDQGILTDAEFEAARKRIIANG